MISEDSLTVKRKLSKLQYRFNSGLRTNLGSLKLLGNAKDEGSTPSNSTTADEQPFETVKQPP